MPLVVKSWMDSNPNDGELPPSRLYWTCLTLSFVAVITLLIVNSDNFSPTDFDTVFKTAGLDTLSYAPPSASIPASQWPTLGSMIDSGKRLVTFLDANADFTSVNYLIDGESSSLLVYFF